MAVWLRGRLLIVIFLFANESQQFEMTNIPSFEVLLGANSIGVKTGTAHQTLRRQLFQAFGPRALAKYASTMEKMTRRFREYEWELLPGQNLERVVLPFSRPRDGLKVKFWRREC